MLFFRLISTSSVALMLAISVPCHSLASAASRPQDDPLRVAASYLKAIQSRDFATAYNYVSNADRRIRDKASYLRSQETLSGFALDLAKRLTADMEIWVTDRKKSPTGIHFELGYRLPAGDEIYPELFDWNARKLNALPENEQRRMINTLESLRKSGKMIMFHGHESLDLVHDMEGWKISLGWPSRSRVLFKSVPPRAGELEVEFLRNDFLVANNEPFDIEFTARNTSARTIVATLNHRIEPTRLEKNLAIIACGALVPLRLHPGETQTLSTSYLLGDLSPKLHVSITYQFSVQPEVLSIKTHRQARGQKESDPDAR